MELPDNLKNLYRHWDRHTKTKSEIEDRFTGDMPLLTNIERFIRERNAVWKQKVSGSQPPYTTDSILATYRFCNIFREFDRQTIEFHTLLNPLRDDFPSWLLNMFYCRMVARAETIHRTGLLSFDDNENKKLYKKLTETPRPRFGTPYVFPISVIQKSPTPTREEFISFYLPSIMKKIASEISEWNNTSVYQGVERIIPLFKYNLRFLWTEVLIDVAYQYPDRINLFGQFPIGPGSIPTIKKLNPSKDPSLVVMDLSRLPVKTGITYNKKELRLSAENWEGIGCEYRKYTNLQLGKGRRRIFK